MKIIVVDNSLDVTGAFKSGVAEVNGSNKDPEYFYFIPRNSRNAGILYSRGVTVYMFTYFELRRKLLNILLYLPFLFYNGYCLAQIVKKHNIDIVYQNEVFVLSGLVAKLFARVKVITHIRVMPTVFPKNLFRIWLQLHDCFADKILAVSFVCAAAARGVYPIKQNIEVVYDFVPPKNCLPPYVVRDCQQRGDLLFLGNYTKGKGHDLALEAVRLLRRRHREYDLKIWMYGSDFGYAANINYRKSLESYIKNNNMEGVAKLCDFTTNVEEVMKRHDLVLNLSVAESFSWVVAEALWFGVPVVATDSGGPGELIESEVSGVLVPPEPSLIADRVWELLQDSGKRTTISEAGKRRITSLLEHRGKK